MRPLDQREATPIPGTEGAFSPFFSPDGQWVGFSADGKLKKVPLAGGAPLTICDCDTAYGSWGPDDTIIFSSDRGLMQVSAAGGARRTVTTLDPKQHETGHLYPDILPGGQAVLFSVWTGGAWDDASIAVQRLDTGERRILGEKGTNARYAPSGHLLFARAGSLMAAPFDLSRLAVTGPAVPVVEGLIIHGPSGAAQFALSKDGRLVYATRAAGLAERTLVWVDRRGGVQPLTATRKAFALPRLSPDGQRVALLTEDNNSDIWIDEIARGTFTRLTFENNDFLPIWTPDGKRVTFSLHAGRAAEPVLDSGRRHRPGREAATERVCSHSHLLVTGRPAPRLRGDSSRQLVGHLDIAAGRRAQATAVPPHAVWRRMAGILARWPLARLQLQRVGPLGGLRAAVPGSWREGADFHRRRCRGDVGA